MSGCRRDFPKAIVSEIQMRPGKTSADVMFVGGSALFHCNFKDGRELLTRLEACGYEVPDTVSVIYQDYDWNETGRTTIGDIKQPNVTPIASAEKRALKIA